MSNPRLSIQEQETFKLMAQNGVPPCDLAQHFNISVSTVHNYKAILRKANVSVPNVKGRHHGYRTPANEPIPKHPVLMLGTFHGLSEELVTLPGAGEDQPEHGYMTITIAGQTIRVDKRASSVSIDEAGHIEVL